MKLLHAFSQRLYLRIWLAVVVGVAVLTLCVAWAWNIAEEQRAQNSTTPPAREMVLKGPEGEVLVCGHGKGPPCERRASSQLMTHSRQKVSSLFPFVKTCGRVR